MENTSFMVLIAGLSGLVFIVLRFILSKIPDFKNDGEFLYELYKKQNKIGAREMINLTGAIGGLI